MRALPLFSLMLLAACSPSEPKPRKSVAQASTPAHASPTLQTPLVQAPPPSAPKPAPLPAPKVTKRHAPPPPAQPRAAARQRYSAIGTEPFWAIRADDDGLTLTRPGEAPRRFSASPTGKGTVRRYIGPGIAMTVSPGPCSDGMSDRLYPDHVQIALDDGVLKGCGGQPMKSANGE